MQVGKILKKIWPILYNKYFLSVSLFLVYTLIFDSNNISSQVKMATQLNKLRAEKAFYQNEIARDSAALHELKYNNHNLEKFARENYYMKKDDEDLFLLIGDSFIQMKKEEE